MAANTSVDVAGMTAAQGNFQNALDQITASASSLSDQASQLAANWTGDAASAFGQALTSFQAGVNTVRTALSGMTETLAHNTGVYSNTSDTTTTTATAFGAGLAGL